MIVFDRDDKRFNYRVAGVCIDAGQVLLQRPEPGTFWFLPGGRCDLMETSEDAVRREFREELACDIEIERLLWVAENFFVLGSRQVHELSLYYKVNTTSRPELHDKTRQFPVVEHLGPEPSEKIHLICQWHPIDNLPNVSLRPTFLRTALQRLPTSIEHVVQQDIERP